MQLCWEYYSQRVQDLLEDEMFYSGEDFYEDYFYWIGLESNH